MTITSPTATRTLDDITADLRAEYDEQIRGLQAAVAKLAAERDRECTRADGLHAANLALVADHLHRQEQLQAEARMYEHVSHQLQDALDAKHLESRRVSEMFAEQFTANRDLRAERANQPRGWLRRNR